MSIVKTNAMTMSAIEQLVIGNDLSKLTPEQRWDYYCHRCESIGLTPAARPFQYIAFQGKLTLYPDKGCAEQLRALHKISVRMDPAQVIDGIYTVFAHATTPDGRTATDMGAVPISNLKGDDLAKAMKKAVTQANRRATFALMGLGVVDLEDMEGVQRLDTDTMHKPTKQLAPATTQPAPAFDGPISWNEPNKWPPDQPIIITAKVVGVRKSSKGDKQWLSLTVEDGDEIVLSTFHLSTEPMLNAAIGKVCDVMYAKKERANQLLSIREVTL